MNIAGSYSPRHAQSLANGRAGNEAQEVVQSFPRVFAPSSHLPLCCPFSLSTLTFHGGQDVELGRVVVGSFAEFSTDPNFLVLFFKDGSALSGDLPNTSVRLLRPGFYSISADLLYNLNRLLRLF